MPVPPLEEITENFEFLDDWEDRYKYVIELGKTLDPLPAEDHNDAYKIEGCVSQVWLRCDVEGRGEDATLKFTGDSDAHIVRGLVAIAISANSGKTPSDILETDMNGIISSLGLHEHLTPQRANGLQAMIGKIRSHAEASL
jgi:cysteine desulfuration protein SufE